MKINEVGIRDVDAELEADYAHGRSPSSKGSVSPQAAGHALKLEHKDEVFVDDLTGMPLPPELCRAARQKELEYFKSKGGLGVEVGQ